MLVLVAVLTAGGAVSFALLIQRRQYADTEATLAAVHRALMDYRRTFRRLPCPGDISTYNTDEGYFGAEAESAIGCNGTPSATYVANLTTGSATACTADEHCVYAGMVPVRTLGLPDAFAFDGWGRRVLYAVDGDFTEPDAFLAQSDVRSDAATGVTRIVVHAGDGSQLAVAGVYLLLSFGPDGHGAYPRHTDPIGPRITSGSTSALQLENCDCTSQGDGTPFDNEFYQSSARTDLSGSTGGFDDIAVFVTRGGLAASNE